jgi:hypothetical protein
MEIFKFEEKIPAISARFSALITFFQVLMVILFFSCQHIESKYHSKNQDRRKIDEILFAMFSEFGPKFPVA